MWMNIFLICVIVNIGILPFAFSIFLGLKNVPGLILCTIVSFCLLALIGHAIKKDAESRPYAAPHHHGSGMGGKMGAFAN